MSASNEAYLLFCFSPTEDLSAFGEYIKAADPIMEKYGGEVLVGGAMDQSMLKFEGTWPSGAGLSLLRFPTRKQLDEFWNSSEYQEIKHLRTTILPPNFTIGFSRKTAE